MSAQERTGWRDQQISSRHRTYGSDCPAVDIDFLLLEFDGGKPAAIIEYKHEQAQRIVLTHSSYVALKHLADSAKIPFLVARYSSRFWWYDVLAANNHALNAVGQARRVYSEREYVTLLYTIRQRSAPESVLRQLNTFKPR